MTQEELTILDLLLKKYHKEKQQQNNNSEKDININKLYQIMLKQNRPITVTELICYNDLDFLKEDGVITTQRVSAYMKKLVDSGRVQKMTDYKKTYFYV
jgi:hypothetical protein